MTEHPAEHVGDYRPNDCAVCRDIVGWSQPMTDTLESALATALDIVTRMPLPGQPTKPYGSRESAEGMRLIGDAMGEMASMVADAVGIPSTSGASLTAESEALLDDLIGQVEAYIVAETWNDEQARANLAERLRDIEAAAAERALRDIPDGDRFAIGALMALDEAEDQAMSLGRERDAARAEADRLREHVERLLPYADYIVETAALFELLSESVGRKEDVSTIREKAVLAKARAISARAALDAGGAS